MTIKDKLAHYEPKPLGEKGRYAVLLPLIYDVKTDKYQILYQVRSEHISQPGEVSFPGGACRRGETFSRSCYTRNLWGTKLNSWSNWHLGRDWLSDSSGENHPLLCWKDKYRKLGGYSSKWRGETVVLQFMLTRYWQRIRFIIKCFYLEWCKRFPIFLSKKQRKNTILGIVNVIIPFYRNLTENIWGMTAMFTHRFTDILKDLEWK